MCNPSVQMEHLYQIALVQVCEVSCGIFPVLCKASCIHPGVRWLAEAHSFGGVCQRHFCGIVLHPTLWLPVHACRLSAAAGFTEGEAWECLHTVIAFFFLWSALAWVALAYARTHRR